MLEFLVAFFLALVIVGIVIFFLGAISFIVDDDTRKETIYKIKKWTLLEYNDLFKCRECKRYFREYQSELYRAAKDIQKDKLKYCPHCEKSNSLHFSWTSSEICKQVKKYPVYLDTHLSCPRLKGIKEKIQMKKSIKLYKERNIIDKQQKEFERVQKQTQDDPLKWLKNIQNRNNVK